MSDEPIFPQIPEVLYLTDYVESVRVNRSQQVTSGYRNPIDHIATFASVGTEGSWLNSRHNPKN